MLEKKLFAVQEELTEMHRRRSEHAQQIIDQVGQVVVSDVQPEACFAKLYTTVIAAVFGKLECKKM